MVTHIMSSTEREHHIHYLLPSVPFAHQVPSHGFPSGTHKPHVRYCVSHSGDVRTLCIMTEANGGREQTMQRTHPPFASRGTEMRSATENVTGAIPPALANKASHARTRHTTWTYWRHLQPGAPHQRASVVASSDKHDTT